MTDDDIQKHLDALAEVREQLRKMVQERERDERRAAFFRKLGVRTPRAVIAARQRIIERMFDGRGLRRRDRAALLALHWFIDRCEMLEAYGRLGNVFNVRL